MTTCKIVLPLICRANFSPMKKLLLSTLFLTIAICLCRAARAAETNAPPVQDPGDTYVLVTSDKVAYSIKEDPIRATVPDFVLVSSLGQMRFPVSHGFDTYVIVDARDKTIKQVREELKKELDSKYYQNATVTLTLDQKSARSAQVYFTGQVRNGVLTLKEGVPTTLYEALVQVGFTEFANLTKGVGALQENRLRGLSEKMLRPHFLE